MFFFNPVVVKMSTVTLNNRSILEDIERGDIAGQDDSDDHPRQTVRHHEESGYDAV